jgi:sirohydrochlorin ferrochelatase
MTEPFDTAGEDAAADVPESLGDPRVDAAVERLGELRERPVGDHVEVFDDIHQRLRHALEDAADPADEAEPTDPAG